ncbi:MAG: gluconate 2-dehydrogenase subunit 3 family protein [Flavobacteriaceae bacterium]|nr:gluconate 2-dehydrogenase subunit 3 family protein [Flavobacteriaceae bacterium]MCY4299625.1 gluconate 2-dehydrogenase subunit 3 family protein [Flavobacteriaceae bacterium]
MKRRQALKNIGLGFGTIALSPAVTTLFQTCQKAPSYTPMTFLEGKFEIIAELMELMIPESSVPSDLGISSDIKTIPGAKELKLPEFVDAYVHAVLPQEELELVLEAFDAFLKLSLSDSSKETISELTIEDLDAQLSKLLLPEDTPTPLQEMEPAKAFAHQLRSISVEAFKANEFIGEQILAYDPIPGKQVGCLDLKEATGGRIWSI